MMTGYEAALAGDFDRENEKATRPGIVRGLLARSVRRRWRHLAVERLDTVKPVVPLGRKFWALTAEERKALGRLFATEDVRGMITRLQSRDDQDRVSLVDAAYWMKGCSSLGRLRYAVMLRVGEGKSSSLCLVDIKESVTAAAPRRARPLDLAGPSGEGLASDLRLGPTAVGPVLTRGGGRRGRRWYRRPHPGRQRQRFLGRAEPPRRWPSCFAQGQGAPPSDGLLALRAAMPPPARAGSSRSTLGHAMSGVFQL